MGPLHEILINQLKRENINPEAVELGECWKKLLAIISLTYKDYDDYRYAMERSLDIASEEINKVNNKYQLETNKLNSLHKDNIILVDTQWTIKSINSYAKETFALEGKDPTNSPLTQYFMFFNSQNQIIDFDKLTLHFECGASYVCPHGTLICKDNVSSVFLIRFYIKPIYQNNQLVEYAFIIEDISAEYLKDINNSIQMNKLNLNLLVQQQKINRLHEQLISNNHLLLMNQELVQLDKSEAIENLQHYLINTLCSSYIHEESAANRHQLESTSDSHGFYFEPLSQEVRQGLSNILRNPNIEFQIQAHIKIYEDEIAFGGFIYELTGELLKHLFTLDILKISLHLMTTIQGIPPKLVISFQLDQKYSLSSPDLVLKLEAIKKFELGKSIEYYSYKVIEEKLHVDFILNFKVQLAEEKPNSHSLFALKCLIIEKSDEDLSKKLNQFGFFELFNCHLTSSLDSAIQLIKEARLDGQEFEAVITDFASLDELNSKVLVEISSYLTRSFIGVIYLGPKQECKSLHNKISLIQMEEHASIDKLCALLYDQSIKKAIEANGTTNQPQLTSLNKSIKLVDFNRNSMIMYLYLLHHLGYQTYPEWNCLNLLNDDPVDLILININGMNQEILLRLAKIRATIKAPILLCLPGVNEEYISQLLNLEINDYLVKPFTLNDFVTTINRMTRDSSDDESR